MKVALVSRLSEPAWCCGPMRSTPSCDATCSHLRLISADARGTGEWGFEWALTKNISISVKTSSAAPGLLTRIMQATNILTAMRHLTAGTKLPQRALERPPWMFFLLMMYFMSQTRGK